MRKYRKKPVVIEAVQYLGFHENGEECELFLGSSFETHIATKNQIMVRTMEGELTASQGDYLIRGVQGEFYPCKPDIFAATYEPAGPPTDANGNIDWQASVAERTKAEREAHRRQHALDRVPSSASQS